MADWFPFSSTFYLDMDDEGVSERAQMLLLRCIAYIANTENLDGYISKTALKKLGLSAIYRRVTELIDAQIMIETDDKTGYVFPAFQKWGQPLIAHVNKKNKDREYQSAKRKTAKTSYDNRATVVRKSRPREEKRREEPTYVGTSAHVSNAHASKPGEPQRGDQPASTAVMHRINAVSHTPAAYRVARAYEGWLDQPLDGRTLSDVATEVDQLLADGIAPDRIAAGIKAWHASDSWSPTQIRRFVAKTARAPDQHTGKPTAKALAHLDAAEALIAEMENQP